jgi:nucleotide-binding universal stress UspA family protein
MTETIIVGIDGSPTGLRALLWAVAHATRTGATIRAIHAFTYTPYDVPAVSTPADARQHAERTLATSINAALADATDPPTVRAEAIEGQAAGVLVDASGEAALLVVGTHGHGRVLNALLGSVSAECVRHCACPVVVVPPPRTTSRHPNRTDLLSAPLY